jgi:hypothetical protein
MMGSPLEDQNNDKLGADFQFAIIIQKLKYVLLPVKAIFTQFTVSVPQRRTFRGGGRRMEDAPVRTPWGIAGRCPSPPQILVPKREPKKVLLQYS